MPEQENTVTTENTSTALPVATQMSLLDRIVHEGRMARDVTQRPHAQDLVGEFVNQVLAEGMTVQNDTVAGIKGRIAHIDQAISDQLNAVMHDPAFQSLEAS